MASSIANQRKIVTEFPGIIRVYDDGTVERFIDPDFAPPSTAVPDGGVYSKDVVIDPASNFSARIYLPHRQPSSDGHRKKLPPLLYFHGGGFCLSSPFCAMYHRYVSRLAAEAQVVVVSFDYRLAPEHPIPAAYEDSLVGARWAVVSHRTGNGPEPWLNDHVDFDRVFLSGDSAEGNIVHNLATAVGSPEFGLDQVVLSGVAIVCPYFSGSQPTESEIMYPLITEGNVWEFVCPSNPDNDGPGINPVGPDSPSLKGLGCKRVLVRAGQQVR